MKKFQIIHVQAVYERAAFLVEAEDEESAKDALDEGGSNVELLWKEIDGSVDGVDSEIESVEEVKP